MAFLLLQAIILPSNSPWTQKSTVSSNISNIEGGRRWLSCWSSGLVPDELQCLFPLFPGCACPALPLGFILVRMCKLSSGSGHSEPADLHNAITAYSSITGFEYANLLMLVAVIRLPWQVPAGEVFEPFIGNEGSPRGFLISSCGQRGKLLNQLPEIENKIQKMGRTF